MIGDESDGVWISFSWQLNLITGKESRKVIMNTVPSLKLNAIDRQVFLNSLLMEDD